MSTSLRLGKSCKVVITNKKKDGKLFENMIMTKPLFDEEGTYLFVVAFQLDLSNIIGSKQVRIQLIEDLLNIVPGVISYKGTGGIGTKSTEDRNSERVASMSASRKSIPEDQNSEKLASVSISSRILPEPS